MGITTKSVPVEAHWSIGQVERAHPILRRAYCIIAEELKSEGISKQTMLQMAVKAVNDTSGPDGLVPTLLVFGAYPRITEFNPPTQSTTQRATAIRKAMEEVSRIRAKTQINKALNERNGPSIIDIHDLPLNSPVLVWREGNTGRSGHWTGPYPLLRSEGETYTVELPNGPTDFRSTTIKPYYEAAPENPVNTETPKSEIGATPEPVNKTEKQKENPKDDPETAQNLPRRNPERTRRTPERFRSNVADISIFLQGYVNTPERIRTPDTTPKPKFEEL